MRLDLTNPVENPNWAPEPNRLVSSVQQSPAKGSVRRWRIPVACVAAATSAADLRKQCSSLYKVCFKISLHTRSHCGNVQLQLLSLVSDHAIWTIHRPRFTPARASADTAPAQTKQEAPAPGWSCREVSILQTEPPAYLVQS